MPHGHCINPSEFSGRDFGDLQRELGRLPLSELVERPEYFETFLKHPAGVKFITQLREQPTNRPEDFQAPEVYVIYGDTGVGKDRVVRQICAEHNLSLWVQPISTGGAWYDGLDRHIAASFPDFDGGM